MTVLVRRAVAGDLEAVTGFTTGTFEWGDYVPDRFLDWLETPRSAVMVAERDGLPVGLARGVLMSPTEAWVHAARVHPDHRRSGVGSALNEELCRWAAGLGARIVRLMTEQWNDPAQRQVESLGYRPIGDWSWPSRDLGTGPIDPITNGGRRVPGEEQLESGSRAEIDPAWIAWSSSEMATAGRGLLPVGWTFRRMTLDDVHEASRARALLQCASGWVIARTEESCLNVTWVVTAPADAPRLARAVVDLAARRRMASLWVMVPSIGWLDEAFVQAGCEIGRGRIYARNLPGV